MCRSRAAAPCSTKCFSALCSPSDLERWLAFWSSSVPHGTSPPSSIGSRYRTVPSRDVDTVWQSEGKVKGCHEDSLVLVACPRRVPSAKGRKDERMRLCNCKPYERVQGEDQVDRFNQFDRKGAFRNAVLNRVYWVRGVCRETEGLQTNSR